MRARWRGCEPREHVALVLVLVDRAREQQAAVALDDPRVVTGGERRRADTGREREQLGETEASVAADARVGRLAARVAAHERRDDGAAERFTQIERHVRKAARMARLARGDHRARRAAGALGIRPVRVEPQAERHADRSRPRLEERHRAVDAAAHRDRNPLRVAASPEPPARARSRARRPAASRHRRRTPRAGSARAGRSRSRARPRRRSGRGPRAAGRPPSRRRVRNRRTAPACGPGYCGKVVGGAEAPPTMLRPRRLCRVHVNLDKPGGCRANRRHQMPRPDSGSLSHGVGSTCTRLYERGRALATDSSRDHPARA